MSNRTMTQHAPRDKRSAISHMRYAIRPIRDSDRDWIKRFVIDRWGAEIVVAHGVAYRPNELDGFVAIDQDRPIGLVTFHLQDDQCEIVTIDSLRPGVGIGTALIEVVKDIAGQSSCTRVWLITTNDNLNALRFYQKHGFVLAAIHRNAIEQSRRIKPQIPLIGEHGIPIRDEIELEYVLV